MKIIYIPIEIKARELISKLFFIANNINQDFVFFIGNKLDARRAASLLGKGIYFYKSINWYDTQHIKSIKKKGNKYISLDEEGGATQSDEKSFQLYLNYRSSLENISLVDRIFTWGNFDFRGWCNKYEDYSSKIFETGSPRFDLWRQNVYSHIFKDEISELKRFSPFFFIPSTFISSYDWLQKEIANEKRMKKNNSKISDEILNKRINARKDSYKNYLEYIKIIKKLSKDFPDHKIIIKPHPTEKIFDWKKKFEGKDNYYNIIVDNKYDLTSYIAASECVIFSESTAGIQSIIMGKKAISYNLKDNITFRNFANKCAPNTSKYKTLLEFLNLKDGPNNNNYQKIIESRFYMPNETSSKMIMNNIKNLQKNEIDLYQLILKSKIYGPYFWVKDSLKLLLIRIKEGIFSKKTKFKSYSLKMPGGIKKIEIVRIFKNLKLIDQVNIKKFGKSGYIIYKKNSF